MKQPETNTYFEKSVVKVSSREYLRAVDRCNLLQVVAEDMLKSFTGDGRIVESERVDKWREIING